MKAKPSLGSYKYLPDENCISWKIYSLAGKKDLFLSVKVDVPSLSTNANLFWSQPVRVFFDIPYYTLSGLNVRYLKINEKGKYRALSWVRYIAKNGDFTIRTNKNYA